MKTATDLISVMRRQGAIAARADGDIPGQPMFATMTGDRSCRAKDFNEDFDSDDLIFLQRDMEDDVIDVEIVGSAGETDPDDDHHIDYRAFENANITNYIKVTKNRKIKKGDEVVLIPVGERFLVAGRVAE